MRQQNFSSLFSVFDALSGFSAFVVVVNLILIGGRSIKPVPISNPLAPLPSLSLSLPHQFIRCSCNSAFCVASALCVCVCGVLSQVFLLSSVCSALYAVPLLFLPHPCSFSCWLSSSRGILQMCLFLFLFFLLFFLYQLGKHSAPTVHSVAKTALRPPLRCN